MSLENPGAEEDQEIAAVTQEKIPKAARERWSKRGREAIESIPEIPESLKIYVRSSLQTPQFGLHHHEGMRMDSHLGLLMETVDKISSGTFPFDHVGLETEDTKTLKEMVSSAITHMGVERMRIYAYLHDIKKPDLMTAKHTKESGKPDRVFTMAEWQEILSKTGGDEEAVKKALRDQQIDKISYRQDKELTGTDHDTDHGPEGDALIKALAEKGPEIASFISNPAIQLILMGIANHEMHFQDFAKSKAAKKFKEALASYTLEQQAFIFTACLIDIASSLSEDGTADFSGLQNMFEARKCFQKIESLEKKGWNENEIQSAFNANGFEELERIISKIEKAVKGRNAPKKVPSELLETILSKVKALQDSGDKKVKAVELDKLRTALESDDYTAALGALGNAYKPLIGMVRAELSK